MSLPRVPPRTFLGFVFSSLDYCNTHDGIAYEAVRAQKNANGGERKLRFCWRTDDETVGRNGDGRVLEKVNYKVVSTWDP